MIQSNPALWGGGDPLDEFGKIGRSLRFRSTASAYLSRTPAAAGNRKTWTFNTWIKRGKLSVSQYVSLLCSNGPANQSYGNLTFNGSDQIYFLEGATVPSVYNPHLATSAAQFRDPSGYLNLHVLFDSTQADPAMRFRVFVGPSEVMMNRSATMPQNYDGNINAAQPHWLCTNLYGQTLQYMECNLAHVAFVDGVALPPTAFGRVHPKTGQWRPLGKAAITAVVDTGGAQSWFLPFDDTTSLTTLCADASRFGNHWTANNVSLTAGASYDSLLDTPTNNFASISRLDSDTWVTVNDAGLQAAHSSPDVGVRKARATMPCCKSGKTYFEATPSSLGVANYCGAVGLILSSNKISATTDYSGVFVYRDDGKKHAGSSDASAAGAAYTNGDVIGVLFDADASTVSFCKNGVVQATVPIPLGAEVFPGSLGYGAVYTFNFGQRPFVYPQAGARAICSKHLPRPSGAVLNPRRHFDVLTRVGDGANPKTVTGLGFSPGFIWTKIRSTSGSHQLYDVVRGSQCGLNSDSTNAEAVNPQNGGVQAFTADGFTMQGQISNSNMNGDGASYVDWMWRAGGPATANGAGSIPAQVSANQEAGVSIVGYTGTGVAGTVGHGLGQPPKLVIVLRRSAGVSHAVWHAAFGSASDTDYLYLDMTYGKGGAGAGPYWNGAPPNAAAFSLGTGVVVNSAGEKYVAYCFAEVPGFSKFGSYVGNGSPDGPFVYCGFRPAFVMVKRIDGTGNWETFDAVRSGYNGRNNWLLLNSSGSEGGATNIDMVSNGFKIRVGGSDTDLNISGATHIFAAFAEFSFRYANAR